MDFNVVLDLVFLLLLLVWTYIMFIYIFLLHLQHQALTEAMSEKKHVNNHQQNNAFTTVRSN